MGRPRGGLREKKGAATSQRAPGASRFGCGGLLPIEAGATSSLTTRETTLAAVNKRKVVRVAWFKHGKMHKVEKKNDIINSRETKKVPEKERNETT